MQKEITEPWSKWLCVLHNTDSLFFFLIAEQKLLQRIIHGYRGFTKCAHCYNHDSTKENNQIKVK